MNKLLSRIFVNDKNWYKMMLSIALPISMQSLITYVVNMIDTVMLGQVGEVALSASSLGSSFFIIINVISMGIGCGSAIIGAQYFGKRELDPIRKVTAIALKLSFLVGLVGGILTFIFPEQIMKIYTSDPDVIREGASYLRVLATSFWISNLSTALTAQLRAVNIVKISLFAAIGSCFVNIFFNYMFIFGHFGAPAMGTAGAALGTVIARVFEFAIVGGYFFFFEKQIGFRLRHLRGWDRAIIPTFIKTALPVIISDIIMVVGHNLVTIIIGHVGMEMTAANSIATNVNNVVSQIFFGLSSAASVLTGNTIGAGHKDRAYLQGKTYYALAIIIGIVGALVLKLLQDPIISLFEVGETTRIYTKQMCNVLCCILPLMLVDHLMTKGVLRGGGDTKFLMIADTVFSYVVAAPLGLLTAYVLEAPVWVIFLGLKSDVFCKVALCTWRFISKKWIRDVTVQK